jgi:hypothetical protein
MKPLYAAVLIPLVAACTVDRQTTVTRLVNTISPEQTAACVAAAAEARGVPEALVTSPVASATASGPVVTMSVGGVPATCKLDNAGNVTGVTFGAAG